MKLFLPIVCSVLITAACCLMYISEAYLPFTAILYSVSSFLLYPPNKLLVDWKKKYTGVGILVQVLLSIVLVIGLIILLKNVGEERMAGMIHNLYFVAGLWMVSIFGLIHKYLKTEKNRLRL